MALVIALVNNVFGHGVQQHQFAVSSQFKRLAVQLWLAKYRLFNHFQHLGAGPQFLNAAHGGLVLFQPPAAVAVVVKTRHLGVKYHVEITTEVFKFIALTHLVVDAEKVQVSQGAGFYVFTNVVLQNINGLGMLA